MIIKIPQTSVLLLLLLTPLFGSCAPQSSIGKRDEQNDGPHPFDVILQYEMNEESFSPGSPDSTEAIQLDQSSNTSGIRIQHQNSRIQMRLEPYMVYDSFALRKIAQFAQPVNFKSIRMLRGPASLECYFLDKQSNDYKHQAMSRTTVTFSDEGVSSFATSIISCFTESYEIYSEI